MDSNDKQSTVEQSKEEQSKEEQSKEEEFKITAKEIESLDDLIKTLAEKGFLQPDGASEYIITGRLEEATTKTHTTPENNFITEFKRLQYIILVYAKVYNKYTQVRFSYDDILSIVFDSRLNPVFYPLSQSFRRWNEIHTSIMMYSPTEIGELEKSIRFVGDATDQLLRNFIYLIENIVKRNYTSEIFTYRQLGFSELIEFSRGLSRSKLDQPPLMESPSTPIPNLVVEFKKNNLENNYRLFDRYLLIIEETREEILRTFKQLAEENFNFNALIVKLPKASDLHTDNPESESELQLKESSNVTSGQPFVNARWLEMKIPTPNQTFVDVTDNVMLWMRNVLKLKSSVELIDSLIKGKRYNQAIENCEKNIQDDPVNSYPWLIYQGQALSKAGEYERAIESFNQAINKYPYSVAALKEKAKALHALGNFDKAIDCYNDALKINPEDGSLFYEKARSEFKKKQISKSIEDLTRANQLAEQSYNQKEYFTKLASEDPDIRDLLGYLGPVKAVSGEQFSASDMIILVREKKESLHLNMNL